MTEPFESKPIEEDGVTVGTALHPDDPPIAVHHDTEAPEQGPGTVVLEYPDHWTITEVPFKPGGVVTRGDPPHEEILVIKEGAKEYVKDTND